MSKYCRLEKDSLVFSEGVEIIRLLPMSVQEKENIKSVVLPSSVKIIKERAFKGFKNLRSIDIPHGVKMLCAESFSGCYNLEEVRIPESVEIIGDEAFSQCVNLKKAYVSEGIKKIGRGAFFECFNLTSVHLPDTLSTIEAKSFYSCGKLESIRLPCCLKIIGEKAFYQCGMKSIDLPDSVKQIRESAFIYCINLKKIDIPLNLTEIRESVFRECYALETVRFKSEIEIIRTDAFYGCSNLKEINIPSSIKHLSKGAFSRGVKVGFCTDDGIPYALKIDTWRGAEDKLAAFLVSPCYENFMGMYAVCPAYYLEIAAAYGRSNHKEKERFIRALQFGKANKLALKHFIDTGNLEVLDFYMDKQIFRKKYVDECLDELAASDNPLKYEISLMLMQYKNEIKGYEQQTERFDL